MSVIAWDGKTLAADRRMSSGTNKSAVIRKVARLPDGCIMGWCGGIAYASAFLNWMLAGADPDSFETDWAERDGFEVYALKIDPAGGLWLYDGYHTPIELHNKQYAIGSGAPYAEAAMYLGCDAVKAVEVACAHDAGCGNGIDTLTLEE